MCLQIQLSLYLLVILLDIPSFVGTINFYLALLFTIFSQLYRNSEEIVTVFGESIVII